MRFIYSLFTLIILAFSPMNNAWAEQETAEDTLIASTQTQPVETMAQTSSQNSRHQGIDMTVNINNADASEIAAMLNGIGEKKAQAIVEYRDQYGQFTSLDDLQKVKGIGAATINKNRDRILF